MNFNPIILQNINKNSTKICAFVMIMLSLKHEIFIKALKPPVNNVDLDNKEDYEKLHKENFKNR